MPGENPLQPDEVKAIEAYLKDRKLTPLLSLPAGKPGDGTCANAAALANATYKAIDDRKSTNLTSSGRMIR